MSRASEQIARQYAAAAINKQAWANTLLGDIQGTTQFPAFISTGKVQSIQHIDVNGAVLREDTFTYEPNLITEVRTLSTGETVTFKHHTDTLQTEVI